MPWPPRRERVLAEGLITQWTAAQKELRQKLIVTPMPEIPRFIVGADAAFADEVGKVVACAVVYDREEKKVIEVVHAVRPLEVPYVPGFLSFREGPCVMDAIRALKHPFGVVCFDGQGYAHPRRCGYASYASILLDVPGIGCAKSRLIGKYKEPDPQAGSSSPLMDKEEQIGLVLRTRDNVSPIYVSVGHRVDLESARKILLACVTKYRIPEPTRVADIEVAKVKKRLLAGEI
jgi:deoxyribonuclease V